ncbi:hypothetical protein JJJ17_13930 [Paracoccus caeni]|uniref:Uncharacterized protein n=1 Tax=Paracoccus caeni TaxID=657651 RepID=A0A934SH92_9RHOB|nr:hypothetical protein [Paracoccus caeni]MBK4217031.1 hypothetical protein [Paracoccus caeni]
MGTEQNQDKSTNPAPSNKEGVIGDNQPVKDQDNSASKKMADEGGSSEKKNRLPG